MNRKGLNPDIDFSSWSYRGKKRIHFTPSKNLLNCECYLTRCSIFELKCVPLSKSVFQ